MAEVGYIQVLDVDAAVAALVVEDQPMLLAGGTSVVDFMRVGVFAPRTLIDINALQLADIQADEDGLQLGALARMSDVAADSTVRRFVPMVSQALELSASAQLRNMASLGGNLMQPTRCPYFREPGFACNKRFPGSGCSALDGHNRAHAVLGGSDNCVATHPSDFAVTLAALDAQIELRGPGGARTVSIGEFYRLPGDTPQLENDLQPGEIITTISAALPAGSAYSHYLKVRERASYEFAVVSVAAVVEIVAETIAHARIAFGGIGTVPWRDHDAEEALAGLNVGDGQALRAAADAALAGARPLAYNGFKVELSRRALVRAVQTAGGAR
jgi:xanthine dehydrogenase YagS FAD-binding subunit